MSNGWPITGAEMPDYTSQLNAGSAAETPSKAGKARLLSLSDLDKRTRVYAEVAELIDKIENELGGPDRLSSARRQIIEAGAMASAMRRDLGVRWLNGDPVSPADFATLANAERRQYEAAEACQFAPRDMTPSHE
jgi:hypothetical protein